jgi:predicted dehydrogenase
MGKVRVGVIGTGWWATDTHIPALLANGEAEVVALCDADRERLLAAAGRYEVNGVYADVQEMLAHETLDGVVVVSSNTSHFAVTRACLAAGLHVMLEKPMTIYAADAKTLVEMAQAAGRELIIGYPFNYAPYAVRAREVIAAGELGPVQSVNLVYDSYMTPLFTGQNTRHAYTVHGPKQYTDPAALGGGHGYVQVTHGAGLLFHVTGLRPQRVAALMAHHGLAVDLIDAMTVQFEGGAVGTVSGNGNHQGLIFRLTVGCANGWVDIDAGRGLGVIHRNGQADEEIHFHEKDAAMPLRYRTATNLVEVAQGRAVNGSSAVVGWAATELLDAAYRSAAQDGQFVRVADLYAA